jgi:hypothetical protein
MVAPEKEDTPIPTIKPGVCPMAAHAVGSLIAIAILSAASPAIAADPPVSGKFTGDGKEAKLAYVTAFTGEPLGKKPTIQLVFTEKDHSKDPKPYIKAGFGDYGSALIITVFPDGQIVGCQVAHTAHKRPGFSSIGSIKTADLKVADGKISGKIQTNGELETFGQKWQVDIRFETKAP